MEKLLAVLSAFNNSDYIYPSQVNPELVMRLTNAYTETLVNQYLVDTPHNDPLSGSQLGKPAVCLAWDKFYPRDKKPPTFAQKRKWVGGHMFELEVMHLLERIGYRYEWQPTVKVFNLVNGHPDFVVEGEDGNKFIVECKHVGDSKYQQYRKGMSNIQYITQFALYCAHYSCGGMWVIGNTDTGEMFTLAVPTFQRVVDLYNSYIVSAVHNFGIITRAESFVQCLEAGIAMPAPTTRKDGSRGIVPTLYESKGTLHPVCNLYHYVLDEQNRFSVLGYNYPQECKHLEPEL